MGWLPEHFGIFAKADGSAHREAGKEIVLVSAISAVPFVIGLIAFILIKPAPFQRTATADVYLEAVFLRGQLFLLSVSFLATSLHRLFNSDRSYRRPDVINIFSMLLFGVIGIFYGINPSFAQLSDPTTRNLSIAFFVLSIIFYYYTAVLSYERPPSIERSLNQSSQALATRLAARQAES